MRYAYLVASVGLLLGTAASAVPQATDDPALKKASLDKVVCHTTAPTGSLISNRKECRPQREWDNMRVGTMHPLQGGSCNSAETGHCE